jgi:hypothetical protein
VQQAGWAAGVNKALSHGTLGVKGKPLASVTLLPLSHPTLDPDLQGCDPGPACNLDFALLFLTMSSDSD